MPELEAHRPRTLTVVGDHPLIGVIVQEGDQEIVRYFTDEAADETAMTPGVHRALALAGAWRDMDWAEALEELERIRHESKPTPPSSLVAIRFSLFLAASSDPWCP